MKTKKVFAAIGVVVGFLIVITAIPAIYDTDDTYARIADQFGDDFAERGELETCENDVDGVGVKAVPFGVVATTCHDEWFVLFNLFPIHTMDAGDASDGQPVSSDGHTPDETKSVCDYKGNVLNVGQSYNDGCNIYTCREDGSVVGTERVGDNTFSSIQVGDMVACMTATEVSGSGDNIRVTFVGEVTVQGTIRIGEGDGIGPSTIIGALTEASDLRLPRLATDERQTWFGIDEEDIPAGIEDGDVVEVALTTYEYAYAHAEVWNTAEVESIKKVGE